MKTHLTVLLLTTLTATTAWAENKPAHTDGKILHDSKCMSCHKTDVYTREDRRVKSLQALSHEVENCMKGPADANWSAAETQAVVEYLNSKFYKF